MVLLKKILLIIVLVSMNSGCLIACDNGKNLNRYVQHCFDFDDKANCENALITLDVLIKKKESEYFSWNSLNNCRKLRGKVQIHMNGIDRRAKARKNHVDFENW